MRKNIILAVALLFGMGMATSAMAASIVGSDHDLSSLGSGPVTSNTTEVCVHCHTPHNAVSTVVPLWNRTSGPNTNFTPYSSTTLSPSAQAILTNPYTPSPISMACLVCHDGTVANQWSPGGPSSGPASGVPIVYSGAMGAAANFGTNLADDHPVSVPLAGAFAVKPTGYYNASQDPTVVRLFSGDVECASCHNAHDPQYGKFLVKSNSGSDICLDCHNK